MRLLKICVLLLGMGYIANACATVQDGAMLYMDHCAGCHSLRYMTYQRMAEDLDLNDKPWFKKQLKMVNSNGYTPIIRSMSSQDAIDWFGVDPPDLSLKAKQKKISWIKAYLTGFYEDSSRPFGVNNRVLPNSAMPQVSVTDVKDILLFLEYVSEPTRNERWWFGVYVVGYLILLLTVLLLRNSSSILSSFCK